MTEPPGNIHNEIQSVNILRIALSFRNITVFGSRKDLFPFFHDTFRVGVR